MRKTVKYFVYVQEAWASVFRSGFGCIVAETPKKRQHLTLGNCIVLICLKIFYFISVP
jgi:hypothetical protein